MARPRSVPEEEALEQALLLFWEKGYDRTSVADLGAAIGVGPSSLYNAFGNKAGLYRRSLEHYLQSRTAFVEEALALQGSAGTEVALRTLLRSAVSFYAEDHHPRGCAMLQSGGAGTPDSSDGAQVANDFKERLSGSLLEFLERRAVAAELHADPQTSAKFLIATLRGLSQLACDGSPREELERVAELALRACIRNP